MWLQNAKKTVCGFTVTLANRPEAKTHTNANTHIIPCMHKHTHRHQRAQRASGVVPWPLVPSQRGAVRQYTTAPLIPCVPLVNFALSPRGSEESCVVSWKGGGGMERRENRGVKPLSVWAAKSLCLHEGWDCVFVCVHARVRDPLQYMWT